ncbi:MAG TPA: PQQ-binding-like beta-propeller repeat protein [Solirubrobacteraceae bacterium]|nr:PQQ-binding-like beta-propeller repeat protein [Solirubrobacteraceae bacterium]
MSSPGRRRRRWPWIAAAAILLLAGGAVAYVLASKPGDVRNSHAEFVPERPAVPKVDTFSWPILGYTLDRRRYFPTNTVKPPYRTRWHLKGQVLLEFPPVIWRGSLYQLSDSGNLRRINKETGHVYWKRRLGTLAAASPAVGDGNVYVTLLRREGSENGSVAALNATTGRIRWSKPVSSRTESSPLLYRGVLYFGDEGGAVYALRAASGRQLWRYSANGAVKGGVALVNGIAYFGDYGGSVHAVRASTGQQVWSSGTSGAAFGFSSGTFYATPAVAFGRVYIGNTDNRMYSFVARTGKLAWARSTGNYVYASPSVADVPGLGPTVYVGSYDGTFNAYNAQSGDTRWTYSAGNSISGGSTIIGNIVYFATLQDTATTGLDIRSGKKVFSFFDGKFDPVISDGKRLYLDGYRDLYALDPRGAAPPARPGAPATTTTKPPGG